MGKAISLLRKLPKQFDLVERILKHPETCVSDGIEREITTELFASGAPINSSFPHPTTREFVLQTTRHAPPIPIRRYVLLDESGMRLVVEMTNKLV